MATGRAREVPTSQAHGEEANEAAGKFGSGGAAVMAGLKVWLLSLKCVRARVCAFVSHSLTLSLYLTLLLTHSNYTSRFSAFYTTVGNVKTLCLNF